MKNPYHSWRYDDEGEEEAGGEPIDDAGVCGIEVSRGVGDSGEGEPLQCDCQLLSALARP